MSDLKSRCLLCPRYCEIKHDEVGECNALKNNQGHLYRHTFGQISSMAVEPIEKKPFKHFMPGTRTLSIGGWGCNLRCRMCESTSISQCGPSVDSKVISVEEIIQTAKNHNCSSVCLTYNEPTIAFEFLMFLGRACHKNDLKFVIKTNAYINIEPWRAMCEVVDAVNVDYKGHKEIFEQITECRHVEYNDKIEVALKNDVHVEISIPIFSIIDMKDSFEDIKWFNVLGGGKGYNIPIHLLKVNPAYKMINEKTTSDEEIEKARDILSQYFDNIYI